jgi:hypothetical protein
LTEGGRYQRDGGDQDGCAYLKSASLEYSQACRDRVVVPERLGAVHEYLPDHHAK